MSNYGNFIVNGLVNTTAGAHLRQKAVKTALNLREQERRAQQEAREVRTAQTIQWREGRELEFVENSEAQRALGEEREICRQKKSEEARRRGEQRNRAKSRRKEFMGWLFRRPQHMKLLFETR